MLAFPSQAAAETYGFKSPTPGVLTSQAVLNPMAYNSLCISVAGIRPRLTYNLANIHSELVGRTNLMAVIPVDSSVPPYSILQWSNPGDSFSPQSARLTRCRYRSRTGAATHSPPCPSMPSRCSWTPSAVLTSSTRRCSPSTIISRGS